MSPPPLSTLKEGEVIEKILTKLGSKELQKLIERATPSFIEQVYREIEPQIAEILIDQYGNYFCQKLFPKLAIEQTESLLKQLQQLHYTPDMKKEKISKKRLKTKFLFVAQDSRGTHAIQSLLDTVVGKPTLILTLSEMFLKDLLKFAYNKHGTHVLIKYLKIADIQPFLEQLYDVVCQNFADLSSDPNGLPVIKNTISRFYHPDVKDQMIAAISTHTIQLSQNAYGNYALQVALEVSNNNN